MVMRRRVIQRASSPSLPEYADAVGMIIQQQACILGIWSDVRLTLKRSLITKPWASTIYSLRINDSVVSLHFE